MSERGGHVLGYISVVGVLVAQSLYASSRGYVVFGCGEFQLAVVWQRHVWYLHQTLAVGACAHDYGAVVVLQRSARYLAGAGCSLVDEHHDRHHGVERLYGGVVAAVGVLHLALHREQVAALGYEHIEYLKGFLHRTSAVVAQVEHQSLHALLLQVDECSAHVFGAVLQILVVVDVSDTVLLHAVVGQIGHLYGFALHLDGHFLARRWALNLKHHRCARLATQVVADVCGGLSNHRFAVDA